MISLRAFVATVLTLPLGVFAQAGRRGADPAELPVEQPVKFQLAINAKSAQALGIALPQSLLLARTR